MSDDELSLVVEALPPFQESHLLIYLDADTTSSTLVFHTAPTTHHRLLLLLHYPHKKLHTSHARLAAPRSSVAPLVQGLVSTWLIMVSRFRCANASPFPCCSL